MPYGKYLLLACLAGLFGPSFARAQAQFEDVSSQAGFTYSGESWGASWGDLNGDRYPDLFASNHRLPPSLYLNLGDGTFADVALELSDAWLDPQIAIDDTHGGTWTDFDNDGDLDLYVTTGESDANQFLVNEGGFLANRTAQYDPGLPQWRARLPVWFDFTGDGKLDFFMASENVAPVFEQTDSGFVNRSAQAGFSCDSSQYGVLANVTGGSALEIICVTNIFPKNAYEYTGMPFTKVTPPLPRIGAVLDVAVADFDGDLTTDVFTVNGAQRLSGALQVGPSGVEAQLITQGGNQKSVAFNSAGDVTIDLAVDWVLSRDHIFIGAAGRHPTEPLTGKHSITLTLSANDVTVRGIAAHTPSQNKGIYIGYDLATRKWQLFNSPGGPWTYAYASIVSTAPVSNVVSTGLTVGDLPTIPALYLHTAARFTNATQTSGLGSPISCISPAAGDFDNDMDVDLYVVCRGAIANLENRLYENQGDGTFVMTPSAGGAAGPTGFGFGTGENVVTADYDVDGFLDLFVTNGLQMVPKGPGGPVLMFHNLGVSPNHWVELDLEGTISNRDGIGASVYAATVDGVTQLREQNGGYHRWAQHHQRIHFGLGANTDVDITVEWPSGAVDVFPDVPVDSLYRVVEGGPIEPLVPGESPVPCGLPVYDKTTERGVFIGRNCATGRWQVRMSSGASALSSSGNVTGSEPFDNVTGLSIEAGDTLTVTTNPPRIDYVLGTGARNQDGFDFGLPASASACFDLTSPAGLPVVVGPDRRPASVPFDLATLGACQ